MQWTDMLRKAVYERTILFIIISNVTKSYSTNDIFFHIYHMVDSQKTSVWKNLLLYVNYPFKEVPSSIKFDYYDTDFD